MVNWGCSNKRTRLLTLPCRGTSRASEQVAPGPPTSRPGTRQLPAVVLNDEGVVEERHLDLVSRRKVQNPAAQLAVVHGDPLRSLVRGKNLTEVLEVVALAAFLTDRDHII